MQSSPDAAPLSLPRSAALILATAAGCGPTSQAAGPAESEGESGRIEFVDVSAAAGLDVLNVSGDPRRWYIPESNGCGV